MSCCSAGLTIAGIQFPGFASDSNQNELEFNLLTIHRDNTLTVYNSRAEMGQGCLTSLTQLLLEDLDADWSQIREVKQGWADAERFGHQNTIGAISSLIAWQSHRQAGGKINLLLRQAAASYWQVDLEKVNSDQGTLLNQTSGQTLTFGDMVDKIDNKTLAEKVELKSASKFHLIGKSKPRLDLEEKINGTAKFGIDQQLPGMKVAVVARCPVFGGKLKHFNADVALKIKGVRKIFAVPSGVAVVADNYWLATKARRVLSIEWERGSFADVSDASLESMFEKQLNTTGKKITDIGNTDTELHQANSKHVSNFQFPFVAHMTMEPMNCTVHVKTDYCEIYAPTQNPQDARTAAANTLGLDKSNVKVNVTLMGGGFGRRAQDDFVVEACEVAKELPWPVKVIWSREDDLANDFFRPSNKQRITAALKDGKIHAWQHKVATLSTSPYHFSLSDRNKDEGDWVAYGGSEASIYQFSHFQTQTNLTKTPMTVGILRGISHGYINFAVEVTIDQLAEQSGQEPIVFRLKHLQVERAVNVLKLLSEKVSKIQLADNQFMGIAFGHEKAERGPYQYYNAVATIVEKSSSGLKVQKVILALDHGQVINPDGLLAQAQGSVIFAQSMMFNNRITLENGQIQQRNFHEYPVSRMGAEPEIELHTVDTQDWPMGVGEKLQGTIQPAIANALSRATGTRVTRIPVDLNNLETTA